MPVTVKVPLPSATAAKGHSKAATTAHGIKRRIGVSFQNGSGLCVALGPSFCSVNLGLWLSIGDFLL
jgi:hypothetical protein